MSEFRLVTERGSLRSKVPSLTTLRSRSHATAVAYLATAVAYVTSAVDWVAIALDWVTTAMDWVATAVD
jgi:hypothetical protein